MKGTNMEDETNPRPARHERIPVQTYSARLNRRRSQSGYLLALGLFREKQGQSDHEAF